ncbi:sensor histidine kinase [Alkaliflexus imshenetskii]|uniref:sensor histidine kinase n=1 Tax=Alkaliflexus imshenetskii TaxID=286730 RepID=UPI000478AB2D|nr:ATP-binding protein [Alkaliflexus imshenetskii]
MKPIAPQRIAGYLTLTFLGLALIFLILNNWFSNKLVSLLITIPVFTATTFYLVKYFINSYIYAKIKPIYKTIHNFKPSLKEITNNKSDLFVDINKEVTEWMKGKIQEIQTLKQLEQYRKEYLGNVSHELKTPIFNIQGYILTLLDGGLDDPNINMLYLKRTEKSIDRMISIINDLEAIAKLESGELEMEYEKFNLFNLVEDVFEMQEIRAKDRHINLRFGKSTDKATMVYADKKRIFQVISNLVVNAIHYGREGGNTTVSFYDMDKVVLVQVRDNGVGIPQNEVPRIFERFYRVDKSRSRDQGGTGLGLAIVKHIIEAHKQTINVNSEYGKGTSFTFTLKKAK